MLLGLLLILTNIIPLRVVDLVYGIQNEPNAVPEVIPSLREWHGGLGSFSINATSHIVVDPSYTAQLMDTAKVFQGDLFSVSRQLLAVVACHSLIAGGL